VEIGGANHALMAESIQNDSAAPIDSVLIERMQRLLTQAKNALGFNEGEYTMLITDIPNTSPSMPAVVMMAKADTDQQIPKPRQLHVLGICDLVNPRLSGQADVRPVMYVNSYMSTTKLIDYIDKKTATVTILQQPKHGYLESITQDGDWANSRYLPNDGYIGEDYFVMQVEGNGYKVELRYFIAVDDDMGLTSNPNPVCKGGLYKEWKISIAPNTDSTVISLDSTIANLTEGAYSPACPPP